MFFTDSGNPFKNNAGSTLAFTCVKLSDLELGCSTETDDVRLDGAVHLSWDGVKTVKCWIKYQEKTLNVKSVYDGDKTITSGETKWIKQNIS